MMKKKQQYINLTRQIAKRYFDTLLVKYEREVEWVEVNSDIKVIEGRLVESRHEHVEVPTASGNQKCWGDK